MIDLEGYSCMQIIECKDEIAWVEAANDWLLNATQRNSAKRLFIPAGDTPLPLYRSWQGDHSQVQNALKQLKLVQLDEILNQNSPFRRFFEIHLSKYVSQIEFIDGAEGGADIALLGIGLNGHVAFHEPGVRPGFYSGCLKLTHETAQRLKIKEPALGLSYGVAAFLRAREICLLVRGESKRAILKEAMRPNSELPAAMVLRHANVSVITDFKI